MMTRKKLIFSSSILQYLPDLILSIFCYKRIYTTNFKYREKVHNSERLREAEVAKVVQGAHLQFLRMDCAPANDRNTFTALISRA